MNNQRTLAGPTPNGGSYAILYFYDKDDNPVEESVAEKAIGVEFDEQGKVIKETYFNLNIELEEDMEETTIIPKIK